MNSKVIAFIIVIIAIIGLSAGIYFASKPSKMAPSTQKQEQPVAAVEAKKTTDEYPYEDFQKWKKDNAPTPGELDKRLEELAAKYPSNYRFSLERIRGEANVKGVHSHAEEFEILEEAARKAIACQCGDATIMRNDLLANKDQKNQGYWKLSTHPQQWNVIIEALELQDAKLLEKSGEHHH